MTFALRNGVFYDFCMKARNSSEPHVFVIDEINRGNLSRIFGELMVLVEPDKRGDGYAMRLAYQQPDDPRFFVPANVHLLGLMNLADRSLALVDYALRRRFSFFDLRTKFSSPGFRSYLIARGVSAPLTQKIINGLQALNARISEDQELGPHFEIGHSYFCPDGDAGSLDQSWYRRIIKNQIAPLLREYWYDDGTKAEAAIQALIE
jgi:5-methylcytosine-specific restriction protein B